ncbi:MAG TPA: iron-sulfur cluster repair di-iron protein [Chitinophagaceae bacterium]|nr:iron-sulfur cluster repair di-iron protein [Chitinophagaceae bacterium]
MNTAVSTILDVTTLEPKLKHQTIFQQFDQLAEGESLTIYNDHDPKPLYYQLLNERGNIFSWQYVEEGPEWWKVRIGKQKSKESEESIGQLAAGDLRKAQVFKKYGLDFCCGGKKTVKEACEEKGLDVTSVVQELQHVDQLPLGRPLPFQDLPMSFLVDYIVNVHHSYIRQNLPNIVAYADKVSRSHGQSHPELFVINRLVSEINTELSEHLVKEETVLFPYIKKLVEISANAGTTRLRTPETSSLKTILDTMEAEHETVGKNLTKIRELSLGYTLPENACASYGLFYKMLNEFESDLELHIHLENNVLFPKASELENRQYL